jgi:hypothetical protein
MTQTKKTVKGEIERIWGDRSLQARVYDAILQYALSELPERFVFKTNKITPMFNSIPEAERAPAILEVLMWLSLGPVRVLDVTFDQVSTGETLTVEEGFEYLHENNYQGEDLIPVFAMKDKPIFLP